MKWVIIRCLIIIEIVVAGSDASLASMFALCLRQILIRRYLGRDLAVDGFSDRNSGNGNSPDRDLENGNSSDRSFGKESGRRKERKGKKDDFSLVFNSASDRTADWLNRS